MAEKTSLKKVFNRNLDPLDLRLTPAEMKQPRTLQETDFFNTLMLRNGLGQAKKVMSIFNKMQCPPPKLYEEFRGNGYLGTVIAFSSLFGITIRLEGEGIKRVNDHGMVSTPIASIRIKRDRFLDICMAVKSGIPMSIGEFETYLEPSGIRFWDAAERNVGTLPVSTPHFPEGVPLVIDRNAVKGLRVSKILTKREESIKNIVNEAWEAQQKVMAPLRKAFLAGWKSSEKMPEFWRLCRKQVVEGKIIPGWKEGDLMSSMVVANHANAYDKRLRKLLG